MKELDRKKLMESLNFIDADMIEAADSFAVREGGRTMLRNIAAAAALVMLIGGSVIGIMISRNNGPGSGQEPETVTVNTSAERTYVSEEAGRTISEAEFGEEPAEGSEEREALEASTEGPEEREALEASAEGPEERGTLEAFAEGTEERETGEAFSGDTADSETCFSVGRETPDPEDEAFIAFCEKKKIKDPAMVRAASEFLPGELRDQAV